MNISLNSCNERDQTSFSSALTSGQSGPLWLCYLSFSCSPYDGYYYCSLCRIPNKKHSYFFYFFFFNAQMNVYCRILKTIVYGRVSTLLLFKSLLIMTYGIYYVTKHKDTAQPVHPSLIILPQSECIPCSGEINIVWYAQTRYQIREAWLYRFLIFAPLLTFIKYW